ncbi:hypothetical protein TTRE_0000363901 [Trichuris trichiura]|uniref:Uncharacterized protein n=1 Tax=Trichuris trichiura TaxID=36087 RepID=A0A077Z4G3_TRITR|nr:hypothetical protein TTRE_0000363901 [Trichuris trichiura]
MAGEQRQRRAHPRIRSPLSIDPTLRPVGMMPKHQWPPAGVVSALNWGWPRRATNCGGFLPGLVRGQMGSYLQLAAGSCRNKVNAKEVILTQNVMKTIPSDLAESTAVDYYVVFLILKFSSS